MTLPYAFRFYRTIVNPEGKCFGSTIEIINIQRAKSEERARQAAVWRFMRHHKLTSWDCLASGCEQLNQTTQQNESSDKGA